MKTIEELLTPLPGPHDSLESLMKDDRYKKAIMPFLGRKGRRKTEPTTAEGFSVLVADWAGIEITKEYRKRANEEK